MMFIFDSIGRHIANEDNGRLYATTGQNIGHFLPNYNIFIDMDGHYLGELIYGNRLLYKFINDYADRCFGNHGDYGNIGNFGNSANVGSMGKIGGFRDVDLEKLK